MDPDLAVTIFLFALVFFYVAHEAHKAHARVARAPERNGEKEIR